MLTLSRAHYLLRYIYDCRHSRLRHVGIYEAVYATYAAAADDFADC